MNSCLICALANQEIPDMKRLFLLAFIAFSLQGYACDICGCSGSTNYLGILPLVQQNLAGFRFQYTGFTHPNTDENFNGQSRVLSDRYYHTEAWFRFYPTERWQVFTFIPYKWNVRTESERTTTIQGIGDIKLMANYALIQPKDETADWKHFLLLGGTISAPTGKYMQRDETKAMLPAWFQIGTGAWGVGANVFYTMRYKKVGLNLNAQYVYNGKNELDYQFGDQTSISLTAFYWWDVKKTTVLPQAGLGLDHFGQDVQFDSPQTITGGTRLVGTLGFDWYIDRFLISGFYQLPVTQQLPEAQPAFDMRFGFSASVFFN
jgi:hypothetical protein